jgi:hypothetical protein
LLKSSVTSLSLTNDSTTTSNCSTPMASALIGVVLKANFRQRVLLALRKKTLKPDSCPRGDSRMNP